MPTTNLERLTPLPGPLQATDLLHVRRTATGTDYRATPDQLPGAVDNRGPNLRPAGPFCVTAYDVNTPGWGPGSSSLADLVAGPNGVLALGSKCVVIYSVAGIYRTYVVADDPNGPLLVWRDGRFSGNQLQAAWVLDSDPSAIVADYTFYPAGYSFPTDKLIRAYVAGSIGQQFFARISPGGAALAPSAAAGDANWRAVNRQSVSIPGASYAPVAANQYGAGKPSIALPTLNDFVAYTFGGTYAVGGGSTTPPATTTPTQTLAANSSTPS